jgi:type II secretory ATPase GspE/PulE/Tfp pilus assembly ATPase PilB-like protein
MRLNIAERRPQDGASSSKSAPVIDFRVSTS